MCQGFMGFSLSQESSIIFHSTLIQGRSVRVSSGAWIILRCLVLQACREMFRPCCVWTCGTGDERKERKAWIAWYCRTEALQQQMIDKKDIQRWEAPVEARVREAAFSQQSVKWDDIRASRSSYWKRRLRFYMSMKTFLISKTGISLEARIRILAPLMTFLPLIFWSYPGSAKTFPFAVEDLWRFEIRRDFNSSLSSPPSINLGTSQDDLLCVVTAMCHSFTCCYRNLGKSKTNSVIRIQSMVQAAGATGKWDAPHARAFGARAFAQRLFQPDVFPTAGRSSSTALPYVCVGSSPRVSLGQKP